MKILLIILFVFGNILFESEYRGKSLYTINKVNTIVNQYKYIKEEKNHWSSADEFFRKRGGDCEDFVVAKAYLLLKNGFKKQDLAIHIFDNHATLIVIFENKLYELDNNYFRPQKPKNIGKFITINKINKLI